MKSDRVGLIDMLLAAEKIREHIDSMTEEQFLASRVTVAATAYELMALGEAAKDLTERTRKSFGSIPWADLRLVRNMVAHEHNALNPRALWRTLVRDVRPIEAALREALQEHNTPAATSTLHKDHAR